ncbi:MAG: hypothetical protein LBD23_20360 [Oscillospiraceae bacterium]|jgi:hypothetical protein|nr:hypothetical protein [Oscillospiraceae bacterium]
MTIKEYNKNLSNNDNSFSKVYKKLINSDNLDFGIYGYGVIGLTNLNHLKNCVYKYGTS